jgi:hypothetical protein
MSATTYAGIDYGLRNTNRDLETGIRFGVIPSGAVPFWYEYSEPDYDPPACPECGGPVVEYDEELHGDDDFDASHGWRKSRCWDYVCESCEMVFECDEVCSEEPLSFDCTDPDYVAHQSGDDCDIFITKSPYFTYAQFCSPCAPGACYLLSPLFEPTEGNKCYCFGRDWFEDDAAPYPIWEVATGELIYVPEGFAEEIE